MENQVAKIGVLTFKNFSENVVINEHFIVEDLIKIIENDQDFVKFEIIDPTDDTLLYSTVWNTRRVTYYNGEKYVTEGGVLESTGDKRYVLTNHLGQQTDLTHDAITSANESTLDFYTVYRHFEQTGTTYNAYAKNPLKLHGKVTWYAKPLLRSGSGYQNDTKKETISHVNHLNKKAINRIKVLSV